MLRTAVRSSPRAFRPLRQPVVASASRRLLTTAPADKKRTWRGAAVRWGLAVAAVYWYNTSPIFADEIAPQTGPSPPQFSESDMPTVDAVIEEKRKQAAAKARQAAPAPKQDEPTTAAAAPIPKAGSAEELEGEAQNEGAFNPETGEINWDCPCLGGMAHGPCGEEFKAAFSCFVYSTEEPKGMDCIDKFQHMQDCFRQYPEIYGAELAEDEEADAGSAADAGDASKSLERGAGEHAGEPNEPTRKASEAAAGATEPATGATAPAVELAAEASAERDGPATEVKMYDATDANSEKARKE